MIYTMPKNEKDQNNVFKKNSERYPLQEVCQDMSKFIVISFHY